jgi:hypothetical protein
MLGAIPESFLSDSTSRLCCGLCASVLLTLRCEGFSLISRWRLNSACVLPLISAWMRPLARQNSP